MFCNVDLNKYAPEDRQRHYDDHLSALDTLRAYKLYYFQSLFTYAPNANSTPRPKLWLTSTIPTFTDQEHLIKHR
jgi:hypothetical protein